MFYERHGENNKDWFISELPNGAKKLIFKSLFNRTYACESDINKDILDFNLNDCEDLMAYLSAPSINAQEANVSLLKQYVDWGINKNKVATMRNPWDLVDARDPTYVLAIRERKYIKDIHELNKAVDFLDRKYDKLIIYMLYSGMMGERCREIRYAKEQDLDLNNNTITITQRNNKVIQLCDRFFDEYKDNYIGEYPVKRPIDEYSDYIIKPFINKNNTGGPLIYNSIFITMRNLNKNYLEMTNFETKFKASTIWKSGMYYNLYLLEKEKGELTKDGYKSIISRYGDTPVKKYPLILREYGIYKDAFWD